MPVADADALDLATLEGVLGATASGAVTAGVAPGIVAGLSGRGLEAITAAGEAVAMARQPLPKDALFPVGCLIKPMLALVCAQLHEQGDLDLDVPIDNYLPELKLHGVPITPAHLLSSTGGYVESDFGPPAGLDWPGLVQRFAERRQAFRPGEVFSYTQTGHVMIGALLERLTGCDPLDLVEEKILRPLAIGCASFHRPVAGRTTVRTHLWRRDRWIPFMPVETPFWRHSISPLAIDVRGLLAFARLLGGMDLPGSISRKAHRRFAAPMVSIPAPSGGPMRERTPQVAGMGLLRYGRLWGHNGSYLGTSCTVRFDPATRIAVVTAANARHTANLNSRLFEAVTGESDFDTPAGAQLEAPIDSLEGEYQALMTGFGRATVTRDGAELRCRFENALGGPTEATLWRTEDGRLKGRCSDGAAAFAFAPDPATGELYLRSGVVAYARVAP